MESSDAEFSRLMKRLAGKQGWFAPTSTVLDHPRAQKGVHAISSGDLASMGWKC
jgi:hypothetical protein